MPKNNKKRGQRGPEDDEEVEKVLQDIANGEDSGTALGGGGGQQKGGKGGKKNRRNQAADEDEEVERILQAIANGEEVPEASQPAAGGKKSGAKQQQQQKKGRGAQRGPQDDEEDGDEEPAPAKQQQQQKGGNKKGANKRNNRRGGDSDDEAEAEPAPAPAKQQQQKGGAKGKNNRRNRGGEDDEEVERVLQDIAEGKEPSSDAGTALGGGKQQQKGGKGGKKNRRGAEDDEEVEKVLQDLAEGREPAQQPKQQQQQQQKGGKKNRRNQAADEDEEVEAVLQAIAEGREVPNTAAPKGGKKGQQQQQKAAAAAEEEEEDGDDDAGEGEGDGTKQLSAAAKKRLKKKQKEQALKAQAAAAPAPKGKAAAGAKGKPGAAPGKAEAAPAAAAKKGPRNAIAAMILKQQEEERKRKAEEERLLKEEEERLRKEYEEELRLRKELEEQRAANRIKKKEKNKDAEKRRAERERQEKLARLGISVPVVGEGGVPKQKKPQSALYAKPKKQRPVQKTPEEQQAEALKQEQAAAAAAAAAAEAKAAEPENWEEADEWEQKVEEPADAATPAPEAEPADDTKEEQTSEEPATSPTAADTDAKGKTKTAETAEGADKKPTLRSPICCILGHVDTGKTKLLDKIRQTNVQGGEAGGITQQIGASFFPLKALKEKTKAMAQKTKFQIKVPGLLVIDTPGHESFTNLRSRGSSLCDIAVLVVDLMHGLEPQTLESIKLLRQRKTPFIVALNKIDRIYGWKETPNAAFQETLKKQSVAAKQEFETRVAHTVTMFAEQGLNAVLYYQNKDFVHNVSLVPTSAHTGEGIPDMLALLIQLTQTKLTKKIVTKDLFQATVLEVKVVEGLGTTIDVILVNGVLHEGDRIVVCGLDGPIATNIRALLTPHPMRELRVKTPYQHHKEVVAAQGVKISAQGLDRAVAGSSLVIVGEKDDEEDIMSRVQADLTDILKKVQKKGVCVQASTLGSLEALLTFLGESNIPVGSINIGPVHRADVIKASVNLDKGKRKEFGCILAFDVPVDKDAKAEAAKAGVRIFTADIIYHLFDQFTAYINELKAKEKAEAALKVVFPCILEIVPGCVFNKKDPIVIGVRVVEGLLKLGTPLCVQKIVTTTDDEGRTRNRKEMLYIGKITSLQDNHKEVPQAVVDQQVAIKIEGGSVTFGRQLDESSKIYSQLSRESIDALKDHFRDVLVANKGMVALIQKLKPMFDIM